MLSLSQHLYRAAWVTIPTMRQRCCDKLSMTFFCN